MRQISHSGERIIQNKRYSSASKIPGSKPWNFQNLQGDHSIETQTKCVCVYNHQQLSRYLFIVALVGLPCKADDLIIQSVNINQVVLFDQLCNLMHGSARDPIVEAYYFIMDTNRRQRSYTYEKWEFISSHLVSLWTNVRSHIVVVVFPLVRAFMQLWWFIPKLK